MKFLAFETSCDDTAIAIVENGTKVLSNIRIPQTEHDEYGGVVPEIAARLHSEAWSVALDQCLEEANLSIQEVDYLAVTSGPGLQTALLNGTTAASFLSLSLNIPLIPIHHIYGHICSVFLERDISDFKFPGLVLVASGGHTDLHLWNNEIELRKLGGTIDDAVGEAFDKTAKMLGLGYPGGPIVSDFSKKGDPEKYDFPRIMLNRDSLDFSFSGLKAAVYREVNQFEDKLSESRIHDICASFQQTVVDTLHKKVERAIEKYPQIKSFHFVGGVSANQAIGDDLNNLCKQRNLDFFHPLKSEYSTDKPAIKRSPPPFLVKNNPDLAKVQFVGAEPRLVLKL